MKKSVKERYPLGYIFKVSIRRFFVVFIFVLIWIGLANFNYIDQNVFGSGALILSVILFILGIPTSLLFRLDNMQSYVTVSSPVYGLIFLSIVVCINFIIVSYFFNLLRKPKALSAEISEKPEQNTKVE